MIRNSLCGRLSLALFVAAALLAAGAGCGGSAKSTGKVSGQVVYKGKAVTEGEINFYSKERGTGSAAKVDGSGKFALPEPLEAGKYTVYVTAPPPAPRDPKLGGGAEKAVVVQVPEKYRAPATSNLSVTVTEGPNDVKLELTD